MDGSSAPFVRLIECAGIEQQAAPRRYLRILRKVEVVDGQKVASLEPFDGQSFFFSIDFDTPVIGQQELEVELAAGAFKSDIADARTFGFVKDVEFLRSLGLARGSSLENSVAIQDDAILNEEGLRHDDEFVRHKMLDALGDLYLAGGPILGHFTGDKSGHAMTNTLLRKLFETPGAVRPVLCTPEMAARLPGQGLVWDEIPEVA